MRIVIGYLVSCSILIFGHLTTPGQNVSDEARRHFDRGMAAVEIAKAPDDLNVAIAEFKQATTLAPDWPEAFFNLGKVQEAVEKYADAISSYRKYLQLAPNAADADSIKSTINKLEFKAESVLSTDEIISILMTFASGLEWQKTKGECVGQPYAFIRRRDSKTVEYPTMFGIAWGPDTRGFGSVTVKDPVVKFAGINMFCGRPEQASSCHFGSDFEIRVESRTHVRVLQRVSRTETSIERPPARNGYYSCEYVKKSPVRE